MGEVQGTLNERSAGNTEGGSGGNTEWEKCRDH